MKKRVAGMLSIIFTIVLCCGNYVLADSTYDIFTYTVSSQKVTITGCNSSASGTIEIPDVINGQTVTTIGEAAFQNRPNITGVIIPSSVTTLSKDAFLNCTGLKSVKLPGTLNSIGTTVFQGCTALETINTENINIIGNNAFLNCSSLKSVNLKNTTFIRQEAFRGCSSLTTVTELNKLLEIQNSAFLNCSSLEEISLPSSVRSIGTSVFNGCTNLQNIFVNDACTYVQDMDGVLCNGTTLIFFPAGRKGDVKIPDGVEIVGADAFRTSTADSVFVPESVKTFRNRVFFGSKIGQIVFPRTVETLGETLFTSCTNLKQICAPSKFAETEADWNNSALNATFYDYIVTYTKDGEVFTKEYVLEGKNAEYPEIFSDSFNFYDENYNEWTGENITSDATIIMEEKVSYNEIVDVPHMGDISVECGYIDWPSLLPEGVNVKLSDGSSMFVPVEWNTDGVEIDMPGVYPISGNLILDEESDIVNPSGFMAEINVTVFDPLPEERYVVNVLPLNELFIDVGVAVESVLPETVMVELSDGSTVELPVIWDTTTFYYNVVNDIQTVYGDILLGEESNIINPGITAGINVTINSPLPEERYVVNVLPLNELSFDEGLTVDCVLPEFVMVELSDSSTVELPVMWDITTFDYNIVNAAQPVFGELILGEDPTITNPDGIGAEVSVFHRRYDKNIVDVPALDETETIYIPYGADVNTIDFPESVTVELDDGSTVELEVAWDLENVDTTIPGNRSISGEIILVDGILNPDNYGILLNIEVMEKEEVDLSLAWIKYNLNGEEYEITEADKTDEKTWTVYIPEEKFNANLFVTVSAEVSDAANANISINQPDVVTESGLTAYITVSAVDGDEKAEYTINFKKKTVTWNVTFLSNGEVVSEQTIKDGYPAYNPGPIEDTGMEFAGWDTDFSCVKSDLTVNALYDEINNEEWAFWYIEKIDGISVSPSMTIEELRELLPTVVTVWFKKGEETMKMSLEVEWEIPEDFFERGADTHLLVAKFVTSPDGTVIVDDNVNAEVNVTFVGGGGVPVTRYIISVSELETVTVPYGTTEAEIKEILPSTVAVILDNGSTVNMNVSWDLSTINLNQEGTYEVLGGIQHGDILNPGEHKAKINVIVKKESDVIGALRAEAITATPGEEITIKITADENLNMAIGSFMIDFDRTMLELVGYEIGDLIAGKNVIVNEQYNDNGIEKMYISFMGLADITEGGDVITLKLKVSDYADDDVHYPISIENIKFYDFNENRVEVENVDGDVHVLHYSIGDVNNNGFIELLDAFRVLQYDVGFKNFSKAEMLAADVSGDGTVNIADALLIQEFDAGLITEF